MQLIDKLINQETLTKTESSAVLNNITNGTYNDSQIVVVVTALQRINLYEKMDALHTTPNSLYGIISI